MPVMDLVQAVVNHVLSVNGNYEGDRKMNTSKCAWAMRRTVLTAASLALMSLSQGAAAQAREVMVGSTLPLTGVGAFYGESARNGATLAAKQVNAAGGINGAPRGGVF